MDSSGCVCKEAVCTGFCECICEVCQENYEVAWAKQIVEKNLCIDCGIPKDLSIQGLMQTQEAHFFEACALCKPALEAAFKAAGLCGSCRAPLTESNPHCQKRHTA